MKTIIHISADFPDPLVPAKTKAVENLIATAHGFRHVVYSLNRVSWRGGVESFPFAQDRVALAYGAPPYGLALKRCLAPVAEAIWHDLQKRQLQPDLIHAHKFSVEGLIAADIANRIGCPFIANLWGDTDIKIFEAKHRLRAHYRRIAEQAAMLLPAAPWTADYFRGALGQSRDRFQILPVITAADTVIAPSLNDAPRLVSVFSLDAWRRKNLDGLARAIGLVARSVPDVTLDIFGGGSPKSFLDASRAIRNARVESRIRLMGSLPHGRMQQTINRYAAFVLPPRRETYGMVHVEALLAGLPILWSKHRGIDGLLDDLAVGYRSDPSSIDDIAAGIRCLACNEQQLKQTISRLQSENAFDHLRRPAIAARYQSILAQMTACASIQSNSALPVGIR